MACALAVVPRGDAGIRRSLLRATGAVLVLVTLASFGILLSRTFEMNGGAWSTLWTDLRPALLMTHFGHVWRWRIPALALAWLAWAFALRHPQHAWTRWLMALALAAVALTRSETGHPADHGDFTLAVWIDWLHLLAAATWVGSLFGMSLAVFPRLLRMREHPPVQAAAMFQRLSTLSGAALAVLLVCGIYNAVQQLGSVTALWTTRYGIVLDIKLAVVLAMIAIGAHNRYVKLPRLLALAGSPARPSWLARMLPMHMLTTQARPATDVLRGCARAVLLESLLGLAVIGATATLIHAMPPADRGSMQDMAGAPDNPGAIHSDIR